MLVYVIDKDYNIKLEHKISIENMSKRSIIDTIDQMIVDNNIGIVDARIHDNKNGIDIDIILSIRITSNNNVVITGIIDGYMMIAGNNNDVFVMEYNDTYAHCILQCGELSMAYDVIGDTIKSN